MSGQTAPVHVPVMLDRIVELLSPALSGSRARGRAPVLVDATLGLGGHSEALLAACPQARLIGIDRDPAALARAEARLAPYGSRVRLVEAVYDQLPGIVEHEGVPSVDAILMDLGLSSLQIDDVDRGFSYANDVPLDMRMNQNDGPTAADLVNTLDEPQLAALLRTYGDEREARRIARAIVAHRPFARSGELVAVVAAAVPVAARRPGHPAKRTFQALRIAVNGELDALAAALPAALDALAPGGRLAVLAYHSGEDRLVKQAFARATSDRVPVGVPEVPKEFRATHVSLTRGAERPSSEEAARNPRAASARLRAVARQEVTP